MLDFLGIGAQKAGTTWLFEMLSRHPSLAFPAGKEIHFWDTHRANGIAWYESLFPGESGKRQGEITPAYAMLPVETIREVWRLNPVLRLFYTIRNPIDRAWSSARMAIPRAEMVLEEASDQWLIDHFRSRGSLGRGNYEQCIRNWRAVFGEKPLLILHYEQIRENPRTMLRAVCEHIGVDAAWADALPDEVVSARVFANTAEPIRPSVLPVLREIYEPQIASLSRYLDMDLESRWLGTQGER